MKPSNAARGVNQLSTAYASPLSTIVLSEVFANCSQSPKCQSDNWTDHKRTCTVAVPPLPDEAPAGSNPTLLLISIEKSGWFDDMYKHTLAALRAKATVTEALTYQAALTHLSTKRFTAVLVTDAAIANKSNKYAALNAQLTKYVKEGGGTVILGCDFCNVVRLDKVDTFLANVWGLPWRRRDYFRTTHGLNASAFAYDRLRDAQSSLPNSYSMKATCLKGVVAKDALYTPVDGAVLESHVYAPTPILNVNDTPAAFTQSTSSSHG